MAACGILKIDHIRLLYYFLCIMTLKHRWATMIHLDYLNSFMFRIANSKKNECVLTVQILCLLISDRVSAEEEVEE